MKTELEIPALRQANLSRAGAGIQSDCKCFFSKGPIRTRIARAHLAAFLVSAALTWGHSSAQPIITAADMFNGEGQYYRAYANIYNALDLSGSTAYVVPPDLIGPEGADGFWDFSTGPTDKVLRFDYLSPEGISQAAEFPNATIAERKTDESNGTFEWLFFEQVPQVGRRVYGFYAENPFFTPSNLFVPPIVDFPDRITYGQEWTTSMTYENDLSISDPDEGGAFNLRQRVTMSSQFRADAHGTIILPDEIGDFGPGLRVTEEVQIDIAIDFGEGQFDHVETDFARNYYWLMPGKGIVAQLNSTQSSTPVPENFTRATAFLRLFETNKEQGTGGSCENPDPVADLRIRVSNGTILLTWSRAECATQYRVEYSSNPEDRDSWTPLGDPTANLRWEGEHIRNGALRFYRVVSLK